MNVTRVAYWGVVIGLLAFTTSVEAFTSGSTGADGAFNPTASTTLQVPASGVFHFTTVTIPSGVLVTFTPNAANSPVTILATGDVTINGTVSVNGSAGAIYTLGGQGGSGGPGGYRGGTGAGASGSIGGAGLGPGGGLGGTSSTQQAGSPGSFGTAGSIGFGGTAPPTYGTPGLLPLIGGSGGGAAWGTSAGGGGGGGGALLIASSGAIVVNGAITANGGGGGSGFGAGGSGGAIRLVATKITGAGSLSASGGVAAYSNAGGSGRIRLEAEILERNSSTTPVASAGFPLPLALSTPPMLKIVSVGGVLAPDPPGGGLGALDILLPTQSGPVAIELAGSGILLGTTAVVKVTPESGAAPTTVTSTPLSGTVASSTASASATLPSGSSFVTATVTIAP